MKRFEFFLDAHQTTWAFSPIRTKRDYAELLLRATKVMLTRNDPIENQRRATLVLHVSKMSRVFFCGQNKIHSVSFPFVVDDSGPDLSFRSLHHPAIDHRATSTALGLIGSAMTVTGDVLDFADRIIEASESDPYAWELLREIMLAEDGYIRYDDDQANANGHIHPRHHIDVFYSQETTFKLGLAAPLGQPTLAHILDRLTECHYVASAT